MNLKKIIHFSIGPIGIAAIGLISIPILTWLFQPEDIGRLSMLQLTNTLAVLLLGLGLDQSYIREYHLSKNKSALLKSAITPGLILLTLLLIATIITKGLFSNLVFGIPSYEISFIIALYIIFSFLTRFLSLILRMEEKGLAYSISQISPKIIFLLILLLYFYLGSELNIKKLIYAQFSSIVIIFIAYAWNTKNVWIGSAKEKIDKENLTLLMNYGYPLVISGVAYWGLTSVDKIMLRMYSSYEELGIYSVSFSFAGVAIILQSIFSTVWAPIVFKWAEDSENLVKIHIVRKYISIAVLYLFLLISSLTWITDFILPDKYNEVKYILISCLCYPLIYTLSETTVVGISIAKKTSYAMIASISALLMNSFLCYILIPLYGAGGAAISTSISFVLFLIARTEFSILLWEKIPRLKIYTTSIFMVLYSSIIVINKDKLGYLPNVISFILLLAYSLYLIKKERTLVNNIVSKIKNIFYR